MSGDVPPCLAFLCKVLFQKELKLRVRATVEGLTPILMNRFHEDAEVAVGSGTRPVMSGVRGTPRDQAEKKAYRQDDGTLFIPGNNFFAALIEAGRFHKVGKRQLSSKDSSLIPAGCVIEDLICSLNTKQWEVDSRSIVNPSTKGRQMCHRPRVDKWQTSFTLLIDETFFDPQLIRLVLDDAGKKIGVGDYRPQKKGPFGRFIVKHWEVIDEAVAA
jgi:hypothetical protein